MSNVFYIATSRKNVDAEYMTAGVRVVMDHAAHGQVTFDTIADLRFDGDSDGYDGVFKITIEKVEN